MNATSRAILQTILTTDESISADERGAIQCLLDGRMQQAVAETQFGEPLLLTQKMAARLLSVSRVTIWRLTRDHVLHPVEILPGSWRYTFSEVSKLAQAGYANVVAKPRRASRVPVAA